MPVPESRVMDTEHGNVVVRLSFEVVVVATLVLCLVLLDLPEPHGTREEENGGRSTQVETVSGDLVGSELGEVRPGRCTCGEMSAKSACARGARARKVGPER